MRRARESPAVSLLREAAVSFYLPEYDSIMEPLAARISPTTLDAELHELSAVSAGKDDIRKIVEPYFAKASRGRQAAKLLPEKPKVLFLDEIHRFNKSQQDFLLPYVESGALTLIGATTENPSFEVIPALISHCRVFVLEPDAVIFIDIGSHDDVY